MLVFYLSSFGGLASCRMLVEREEGVDRKRNGK